MADSAVQFSGMQDALDFLRSPEIKELRARLSKSPEFFGLLPALSDVVVALPRLSNQMEQGGVSGLMTTLVALKSFTEAAFIRGYQTAAADRARQFAEKLEEKA